MMQPYDPAYGVPGGTKNLGVEQVGTGLSLTGKTFWQQ